MLVVVHTERGDGIRIISAWRASRKEHKTYEESTNARRYKQGTNVVVLEPDVAKAFPDAEAVNSSLRALVGIIKRREKAVASK